MKGACDKCGNRVEFGWTVSPKDHHACGLCGWEATVAEWALAQGSVVELTSKQMKQDERSEPVPIEATLTERGARYGSFVGHADITQRLKFVMHDTKNWLSMSNDQREALDMVAHKIGRILNGDPDYIDSWVDIEGYVHLVTKRLMTGETK